MCLYGYEFPRFRWNQDPSKNQALDEALNDVNNFSFSICCFLWFVCFFKTNWKYFRLFFYFANLTPESKVLFSGFRKLCTTSE